jgi:hypothetical protein
MACGRMCSLESFCSVMSRWQITQFVLLCVIFRQFMHQSDVQGKLDGLRSDGGVKLPHRLTPHPRQGMNRPIIGAQGEAFPLAADDIKADRHSG